MNKKNMLNATFIGGNLRKLGLGNNLRITFGDILYSLCYYVFLLKLEKYVIPNLISLVPGIFYSIVENSRTISYKNIIFI